MAGTLVQFRLPDDEISALRVAGAANNRTVPGEIRHRLTASLSSEDTGEMTLPRAIGALVTIIAERAERHIPPSGDPQQDRAQLLATVRDALVWTLDNLGAQAGQPVGNDEFPVSKGIVWDLVLALKASTPLPYDTRLDQHRVPREIIGFPSPLTEQIRKALAVGPQATTTNRQTKQSKPERKHDDKKA